MAYPPRRTLHNRIGDRVALMSKKLYDIDSLLEEVVTLPSMPDSLARITDLVANPNCVLGDVALAISGDPAIAIKTLRLVNSAYYGLGQEVSTVEHAVVLLGLKVIKNLALTATVFDTIKGSAELFLRHCVGCGVAMRVLAETSPLANIVGSADEAFVYGLLHDIGKVILLEYLPEEYAQVPQLVREKEIPWFQAERELIGTDHAELGARLALKWKLSKTVVNAIAGHHDLNLSDAEFKPLAATLSVADYLCSASGLPSHPHPYFVIDEKTWTSAAVEQSSLAKMVNRFFESFSDINELVKVAA